MKVKPYLRARVNEEGHLVLPPEAARRYGLTPGAEVYLDEQPTALALYPVTTHLAKLYIEPTNRCNLECRTCIRNSWNEPLGHMDEQTFVRIIEGLAAFEPRPTVFFGGFGEPLCHPDIVAMVSRAKAAGSRVEMITNGTLLTKGMSERLIDAGLDMLWVSLDGAKPESYTDVRIGAALPQVLANLATFNVVRGRVYFRSSFDAPPLPQIGIAFVAMRRNIADLPSVIRLGKQRGATHFMVTNVLPYTPEMYEEVLYAHAATRLVFQPVPYEAAPPEIDGDEDATRMLFWTMLGGRIVDFSGGDFTDAVDRCRFMDIGAAAIAWDGGLVPCLPLLHDHTSFPNGRERFSRRYVIGNVAERPLKDLWEDPQYAVFRDRVRRFDFSPCAFCGGCELSEKNEEDCTSDTFPTCGGCLWAQGLIQCP